VRTGYIGNRCAKRWVTLSVGGIDRRMYALEGEHLYVAALGVHQLG
jgi:hypothetical protein